MTTAIAERTASVPAVTNEQLDLVKRTVAQGATDAELKLYLFDCQRQGVHPLDKLIHFTKRGGRYCPVTSIDFMRSRAAATGEMAGSDDPRFEAGAVGGPPLCATVTVYRITQGQRFAYAATARWAEYCPDNAPMWKRMPHTMLGKCAEALALRKAFPQQLAGLYAREEMDQADIPLQGHREEPEKPSAANGGELAAPIIGKPEPIIDTTTGEERPAPPAGFHYVQGYTIRNGWHEFNLLHWTPNGDPIRLSTKKNIGHLAGQAEMDGIPVKVSTSAKRGRTDEAYVDSITLYKSEPDLPLPDPAVHSEPLTDDQIPFMWLLAVLVPCFGVL